MTIIFFGSDDFAQAHLEAMIDAGFTVVATVTQPDRPKGRGMQMHVSPIKETSQKHGIDCLQPQSLKDEAFLNQLKGYNADLFVVIAFGRFLTGDLLSMPKKGAVNVHGSLLPQYRGAAPIHWAILNGETQTGVTVMYLNKDMDAGDIIEQASLKIEPRETTPELRQRMIELGKKTLLKVLGDFKKESVQSKPQNKADVTFAPKLTKELGQIDWSKSAEEIDRQIRALQPWPGAYTSFDDKALKILRAQPVSGEGKPGELIDVSNDAIDIATGEGVLRVFEVHLAGAKAMTSANFLRGHRLQKGFCFEA